MRLVRWAGLPGLAVVAGVWLIAGLGKHGSSVAPAPSPTLLTAEFRFERNLGQADPEAQFLVRGRGYQAFFTRDSLILSLREPGEGSTPLRLRFLGSANDVKIEGLDPLPGRTHYFLGNDPARWHPGVTTYRRIRYQQIYPGVDLIVYGRAGELEYDLVVSARIDPGMIRLGFEGPWRPVIGPDGELTLSGARAKVIQRRPTALQGNHTHVARYVLHRDGAIGVELGDYDKRQPLVIDPVIVYSSYLGGTQRDGAGSLDMDQSGTPQPGNPIAVDQAGNIYLTGETDSIDFPVSEMAVQSQNAGASDAFVTKIDATGSTVLFSTYLGGSGFDRANSIAVDSLGNVYVAGRTNSTDFPTVRAVIGSFRGGEYDGWMSQLAADGSSILYSTYLGGSDNDAVFGIALDGTSNVYLTGGTKSDDFPATRGAFSETRFGGTDAFVTKLDVTQSGQASLIYSTFLGGIGTDRAHAVAVDGQNQAIVTGHTASLDFPTLNGFQNISPGLGTHGFLTVLNAAGSDLVYSTFVAGTGFDSGNGVALDSLGRAYVAGYTRSSDFPVRGAYQSDLRGSQNAFFTAIDPSQTGDGSLLYSTFLGGSVADVAMAVAVDSLFRVYLVGITNSGTDFPITADAFQAGYGGAGDAFVAKLDPSQVEGASFLYSSFLGGANMDVATGVAVDPAGAVWVAGQTSSSDFPVTSDALQNMNRGAPDAFVTKIADTGNGEG